MPLVDHRDQHAPTVVHLTAAERRRQGKAVRSVVPRSELAGWAPTHERHDPVDLLERQAATRVPELVPLRHARMLASPFAFYRGGALLMASDLAGLPRTSLTVQLCGDAHLSNFGIYGTPDRRLVFSLNDFDETLPGPFEWDVKRLAASFAIAGRSREFNDRTRSQITQRSARAYREAMREFAGMGTLDVWYSRLEVEEVVRRHRGEATSRQRKNFKRLISKARAKDSMRAARRLTQVVDGEVRFVNDPPLVMPVEELLPAREAAEITEAVHEVLRSYRASLPEDRRRLLERYRYVHLARKVVGVGSVGTRAWVLLLVGRDDDDPLVLQFKEAQASVLEDFLGASAHGNHGERVVAGQRLMQAASDIMLGWIRTPGIDGQERDFFVRQLWDAKASAVVEKMAPEAMAIYADLCGWTLARAHARSGDPIAIAAYLGTGTNFDRAMASFAEAYADQNQRDHTVVQEAVVADRLRADTAPPARR